MMVRTVRAVGMMSDSCGRGFGKRVRPQAESGMDWHAKRTGSFPWLFHIFFKFFIEKRPYAIIALYFASQYNLSSFSGRQKIPGIGTYCVIIILIDKRDALPKELFRLHRRDGRLFTNCTAAVSRRKHRSQL